MTTRYFIPTIFFLTVATAFQVTPDKVVFRGQLLPSDKNVKEEIVGLNAIIKGNGQLLASTFIDATGQFTMTFQTTQHKTFDLFVAGIGVDASFIKSFTTFNQDTVAYKFGFPQNGKQKKILGTAICPKCDKADKVYPIIYGDNQKVIQVITNGDTIESNIVNKKYYAGTCVHGLLSPNWYCDRDKIKFY